MAMFLMLFIVPLCYLKINLFIIYLFCKNARINGRKKRRARWIRIKRKYGDCVLCNPNRDASNPPKLGRNVRGQGATAP